MPVPETFTVLLITAALNSVPVPPETASVPIVELLVRLPPVKLATVTEPFSVDAPPLWASVPVSVPLLVNVPLVTVTLPISVCGVLIVVVPPEIRMFDSVVETSAKIKVPDDLASTDVVKPVLSTRLPLLI